MRHLRRSWIAGKTAVLAFSLLVTGSGAVSAQAAIAPVAPAGATAVQTAQNRVTKELRALEASFKGRIGAYAVDTATGKTIEYRAGERFPLLSTFKTFLCAAALHKARTSTPGLMGKRIR